jgi:hypothetical protein
MCLSRADRREYWVRHSHPAGLCAQAHGFSLHAGVRCGAHQRKKLERLCRYITRPAIANEEQLWISATDWYGSIA